MFTPKQLQAADIASTSRLEGRVSAASGRGPFAQYADDGVEVLSNNTPNSFTTDRAAQLALGGSLLGAGTGAGALYGGQEGAATGGGASLAALALLAAGGTKGGQRVLGTALFGRPEASKKAARLISKNRGLFGSATIPLMLRSQ